MTEITSTLPSKSSPGSPKIVAADRFCQNAVAVEMRRQISEASHSSIFWNLPQQACILTYSRLLYLKKSNVQPGVKKEKRDKIDSSLIWQSV